MIDENKALHGAFLDDKPGIVFELVRLISSEVGADATTEHESAALLDVHQSGVEGLTTDVVEKDVNSARAVLLDGALEAISDLVVVDAASGAQGFDESAFLVASGDTNHLTAHGFG